MTDHANSPHRDGFSSIAGLRLEIERLIAERDEARRMVCRHEVDPLWDDMIYHAKLRGWDCFKEDRK
jgi:hypothetical protein